MDTNGSDGIGEWWIDGVQVLDVSNIDYGTTTWTDIRFLSNQNAPNNGGCTPVDVDDIAINNTGYIGPLDGSTPTHTGMTMR